MHYDETFVRAATSFYAAGYVGENGPDRTGFKRTANPISVSVFGFITTNYRAPFLLINFGRVARR
jgi:hypothetical protein